MITLLSTIQLEKLGPRERWVFPSKKSRAGHIGLWGLEHGFRNVARKLEIPDARHTFGTLAMAETKNPGLVKEVTGHESLTTTTGCSLGSGSGLSLHGLACCRLLPEVLGTGYHWK